MLLSADIAIIVPEMIFSLRLAYAYTWIFVL